VGVLAETPKGCALFREPGRHAGPVLPGPGPTGGRSGQLFWRTTAPNGCLKFLGLKASTWGLAPAAPSELRKELPDCVRLSRPRFMSAWELAPERRLRAALIFDARAGIRGLGLGAAAVPGSILVQRVVAQHIKRKSDRVRHHPGVLPIGL
jgi:hypothetical protein